MLESLRVLEVEHSNMRMKIGLVGVTIRIGRSPVQTPLGVLLGLRTQPCHEAPGDLQVEVTKTQLLT